MQEKNNLPHFQEMLFLVFKKISFEHLWFLDKELVIVSAFLLEILKKNGKSDDFWHFLFFEYTKNVFYFLILQWELISLLLV